MTKKQKSNQLTADMESRVTPDQVARRLGVSRTRINQWLAAGTPIPFIKGFYKLNPDSRTSPYIIIPSEEFTDRRKKYKRGKAGRRFGTREGIDFRISNRK